jgi:hypothetical protein
VTLRRLLILVEGPTEERFVTLVLRDHLLARSVYATPRVLVTKRVDNGPNFKGGVTNWDQIKRDLRHLLGDTNAAGITMLIDYYGLPRDVPGMTSKRKGSREARVAHVENAIGEQFGDRRFRPFLMLHEFEALLFTDIKKWQHRFDDSAAIARLKSDVAGLKPEEINETPEGAPSKRILRRLDYQKPLHGPDAIKDIGLDAIRAACPHFAAWLAWAESLGDSGDADGRREEEDGEAGGDAPPKRRSRR